MFLYSECSCNANRSISAVCDKETGQCLCKDGYWGKQCNEHFCSINDTCSENEGDCNNDIDCQSGLKCGTDNCHISLGFASDTDCCYNQSSLTLGDVHFCTADNPCGENEGDCNNDNECQDDLVCGIDNCPI